MEMMQTGVKWRRIQEGLKNIYDALELRSHTFSARLADEMLFDSSKRFGENELIENKTCIISSTKGMKLMPLVA